MFNFWTLDEFCSCSLRMSVSISLLFWKMWCLFFFFNFSHWCFEVDFSVFTVVSKWSTHIWKTPCRCHRVPGVPNFTSAKNRGPRKPGAILGSTRSGWNLGTPTVVFGVLGWWVQNPHVVFTGFQKNIPGWVSRTCVFFLPTTVSLISLILDIYFMHLNFFQPVKKKHPRDSLIFWSTNLGTPWQKLSGGRACKSGLWCIRGSHIAETSFCRCPGL